MLQRLFVQNFALIEEAELDLQPGLNLITGETGAGKSLILDAVNLLIGGRASLDDIRQNTDKVLVEGLFILDKPSLIEHISEFGIQIREDNAVLMSREFFRTGKNQCRINGKSIPLSMYREIGNFLIDIQGQHEQQSLANPKKHRILLDSLDTRILEKSLILKELFQKYKNISEEFNNLEQDERSRMQRMDILRFQIEEINTAALNVREDDELEKEKNRLANLDRLQNLTSQAYQLCSAGKPSVTEQLDLVRRALTEAGKYDKSLERLVESVNDIFYSVEDISHQLRDYNGNLDFAPDRLELIEQRLYLIRQLKRKYGPSIEEILFQMNSMQEELNNLEMHDHRLEALEKDKANALQEYQLLADEITQLRKKAANKLESKLMQELTYLGMPKVKVSVHFLQLSSPTVHGSEDIEFLIAPNPGEPLKPLAKTASGGEMARVLLAFKTILSQAEQIPTMIFDEIDAGVGGQALKAVAEKMDDLSNRTQVLCVTHAPQLAAYADNHFLIQKEIYPNKTILSIQRLDNEQRVEELARMLGGKEITEITRSHAQEMINLAKSN